MQNVPLAIKDVCEDKSGIVKLNEIPLCIICCAFIGQSIFISGLGVHDAILDHHVEEALQRC